MRALRRVAAIGVVLFCARAHGEAPPKKALIKPGKPACIRVVADAIDATDLRLAGSVEQDGKRRLLLVDRKERGYVIAPRECAGRERVPFDTWVSQVRPLIAART